MNPEARQKFREEQRKYDEDFHAVLMKDIPYFHELYAKYHDEEWLAIAKNLGIAADNIKNNLNKNLCL